MSSCDSLKIDYIECVNYALSVENKALQLDTLVNAQKSLISNKNALLVNYNEQLKLAKKKKNRQRFQFGLFGILIGLVFGLSI